MDHPCRAGVEMPGFGNVSVDLDSLAQYHRIHGLQESAHEGAIYERALPRMLAWFAERGLQATLFVVASDLGRPATARALRAAAGAGHELASHSFAHDYAMRRWSERSIARDLDRATAAISEVAGRTPRGFRTPGYNVDIRILRLLAERGYTYDSSVFPCPAYLLAKGTIMTAMAALGRPSGSSMTDARATLAPREPYRPGRHDAFRPGDRKHSLPLWEIPISVTRRTRLPLIGTSVAALPPWVARRLGRSAAQDLRHLQFELHALDFMDRRDPEVSEALVAVQPDLRRPWEDKVRALNAFVEGASESVTWVRLEEQAQHLDRLEETAALEVRGGRVRTIWSGSSASS